MNPPRSRRRWLAGAVAVSLLAASCSGSSGSSEPTGSATESQASATSSAAAPSADRDLSTWYETAGDPDADVVVVNTQGGPITELAPAAETLDLLGRDDVYVITVHQSQTHDPSAFIEADLTFDEAIDADDESVLVLAEVVEEQVARGREVYVVGISFGAFMVADLLAAHGDVADGYLIANGRLDMPDAVWKEFAEGRAAGFVNGVDVVEFDIEDAGMGAGSPAGDRNMARLAAGLGHRRYTELLDDVDLSKVVYVYGTLDEQVGSLTADEVDFLQDQGAQIIRYEGGHDAPDAVVDDAVDALLGPNENTDEADFALPELQSGPLDPDDIETGEELLVAGAQAYGYPDVQSFIDYLGTLTTPQADAVLDQMLGFTTEAERDEFLAGLETAEVGEEPVSFSVDGEDAIMQGVIDSSTPGVVQALLDEHPAVTTIVMGNVPGSADDEANLTAARMIRDAGLATHVPADGAIASGGVDFYLAGVTRTYEPGARFGVHSWSGGPGTPIATDLPRDDPEHQRYLEYYDEMDVDDDFYWFTLSAAPAESIHWMTDIELDRYGFATE